jgi:hypothetical protein
LKNKLTEVIDQTGLDVLISGADEVDMSNITPFIINFLESPSLKGKSFSNEDTSAGKNRHTCSAIQVVLLLGVSLFTYELIAPLSTVSGSHPSLRNSFSISSTFTRLDFPTTGPNR